MPLALALLVLLTPATAFAADGAGMPAEMGWLVAAVICVAGGVFGVVQTKRLNDARSSAAAVAAGDRQVALDIDVLRARAKTAREAGTTAEFAAILETELTRAQCGGCAATRAERDAIRAELKAERAESRAFERQSLERVLTSGEHTIVAVRELTAVVRESLALADEEHVS